MFTSVITLAMMQMVPFGFCLMRRKTVSSTADDSIMFPYSEAAPSNDISGFEMSVMSWNIDGLDGNSLATRLKGVRKIVAE